MVFLEQEIFEIQNGNSSSDEFTPHARKDLKKVNKLNKDLIGVTWEDKTQKQVDDIELDLNVSESSKPSNVLRKS
eukprot:403343081